MLWLPSPAGIDGKGCAANHSIRQAGGVLRCAVRACVRAGRPRAADRVQGQDTRAKVSSSCAEMFVVMICAGEGKFAETRSFGSASRAAVTLVQQR